MAKSFRKRGLKVKGVQLEGLPFGICALEQQPTKLWHERTVGAKGLGTTGQTSHSPQRLLADILEIYASVY